MHADNAKIVLRRELYRFTGKDGDYNSAARPGLSAWSQVAWRSPTFELFPKQFKTTDTAKLGEQCRIMPQHYRTWKVQETSLSFLGVAVMFTGIIRLVATLNVVCCSIHDIWYDVMNLNALQGSLFGDTAVSHELQLRCHETIQCQTIRGHHTTLHVEIQWSCTFRHVTLCHITSYHSHELMILQHGLHQGQCGPRGWRARHAPVAIEQRVWASLSWTSPATPSVISGRCIWAKLNRAI